MPASRKLLESLERISSDNNLIHALSDVIPVDINLPFAGGRLSSMPIAIKDMIDTTPARCIAGLSFLSNYRPDEDAVVVRQLRAAGAIVVGVCETDAAGCGARTPRVRHPRWPGRIVGGSSGGCAAAVLAGFAEAAIGTDTGGSVRIPAACCGIVGFKPTHGRICTDGVRPLAPSFDHLGIMATNVDTIALIADVLDPRLRYLEADKQCFQGGSIACPAETLERADPEIRSATERVARICADLGYAISTANLLPRHSEVAKLHWAVFAAEAAVSHREFLPDCLESYPSIARLPLAYGMTETASEYILAKQRIAEIGNEFASAFRSYQFLLLPTIPILPPLCDAERVVVAGRDTDVTRALISNTILFNHVGYPAIALPVSLGPSVPSASVQIVAKPNEDSVLLKFARCIARALDS
jgi:aspartyl-tRNA(Asn)/glutamyl-tRNA(Gln) amidotransferase subunit A